MIKSIKFTGEYGYIANKISEPMCPVRNYDGHNFNSPRLSDTDREEIKEWRKEHRKWTKHKNEYAYPQLVKNLLNKTITFEPGKINIIFGPNGSGKTTIIKALAGNSGTTDGFPTLESPMGIGAGLFESATPESYRKHLIKDLMKNSAEIEWDGSPIYYDNFAGRRNTGSIGDLSGSVLGNDIETELSYTIMNNQISRGQNSIYLINRLFHIAENHISYAELFSDYVNPDGTYKNFRVNDTWEKAYKIQLDYFMGFEKSLVKSPGTFLFDEIDKSLDIDNICVLYDSALPSLVKDTGIQVIIISHNPIILSDRIRNNEYYNFISMDEEYTERCITNMNKLFK